MRSISIRTTVAVLAGAVSILLVAAAASADPWRLDDVLGAPDWASVEGTYRIRYEHLENPFRPGSDEADRLLVERLLLALRFERGPMYAGLEIEDSRAQLADAQTPLGTDDVNALEPLQAYVGMLVKDAFRAGGALDVVGGRITIDAGSRRLAARNRFRNTLNAFTGLHARWTGADGELLQVFYTLPLNRLPATFSRLDDNEVKLDEESGSLRFWGVLGARKGLWGSVSGELYVYGLEEHDSAALPSPDRQLYTPGFRLFLPAATGAWDFEVESALQFGTSRASVQPTDQVDLDHRAALLHLQVGRSFRGAGEPRLVLQYDYASGDDDPTDGENNRFDTLYGARRFDFGPTGIYGALARSNLSSPGVRLEMRAGSRTQVMAGYRAVYLASRKDAFTGAGLRDAGGAAGDFVGNQLEFQMRHKVVPDNLEVEFGGAWLSDGEFLRAAPGAPVNGDALYLYLQAELSF